MKKMKKISKLLILLIFATISCNDDVLDIKPSNFISDATLWESEGAITQYLANIYGSLETPFTSTGDLYGIPGFSHIDLATDDGEGKVDAAIQQFNRGELSPSFTPYGNRTWQLNYEIIRKVNLFLEGIKEVEESVLSNDKKEQYSAEVRFIRAYMYFELVRMFGGVPLITAVQYPGDENIFPSRNSTEEVFNFIFDECDDIADVLTLNPTSGHASKGAALSLLSRAKLYHASPLFNNSNNVDRWNDAANAAKAVIDLGMYSLYNDYRNLFLTVGETNNPEIIWSRIYKFPEMGHTICMLWGFHAAGGVNDGTWGGFYPTQEIVDAYEMTNGKAIIDPESGYDPQNPYENRDPRLSQTILYNGSKWRDGIELEFFEGGNADPDIYSAGGVATGYGLKKFDKAVSNTISYYSGEYYNENDWIFFRYAEILLNYAEAKNEVLSSPDASVYDAINLVRARESVNMPPLPSGLSKDEMRERIRNERRVELVYESHRFFDIRRWRIGSEVLTKPIHRVKIVKEADGTLTYSYPIKENRVYFDYQRFLPIPLSEMEKNENLVQNDGYN
jgi:starch-binding outer membrane protein, SusD/RagB family